MNSTQPMADEKLQRIIVQHTLPGAALAPSSAVMWRVRVAETGRIFEVPVFETTTYHEFLNILMVLPGVPSSSNEIMYLVGPPPYRLLTSKKYKAIVQSEERGNVFVYNVSSQRVLMSPSAEPMDRSNKTIEYILTTSIKIVDKARQNMLEQEVQVSAINSLIVYAASSLESFYKSYFGPVIEKLDLYRTQIASFDQLLVSLSDTPLHPAITELDAQRLAEGLASTGGSFGGVSRGSVAADATPPGSRAATPNKGEESSSAVPVLDTPGGAAAAADQSSGAAPEPPRRPKANLLDCINAESWRAKRDLFEKSCHEIQGRLDAILTEYKRIAEAVPTPFMLCNVHMNVASLFRTTALLRSITALPAPLMARAAPPTGVKYAEPSPMATNGPDLTAAQALSEILGHGERAPTTHPPSSPDGGPVEVTASPPSASAVAAVSQLLVATMPPAGSTAEGATCGESVESDPRDAVSIYVVMERTLQKQLKDAFQLGELPRELLSGSIFLKDFPRKDSVDHSAPAEATSSAAGIAGQGQDEDRAAAVAVMAESLQRRRYRMDQMSKALEFFKERVADEVVRISRIVRDLKVGLKQIEKSESVNFLKMWREGQNKHSSTLTFLQNYPAAYETFLGEVTRIRRFNIEVKSKLEELSYLQNNEMQARKNFWDNTLRFLPPFFLDIVPSVRRPPPLLVGPAGIPGFEDLLAVLPDFEKGSQHSDGSQGANDSSSEGGSAENSGDDSQDGPDIVMPVAEDNVTAEAEASVSGGLDGGSKQSVTADETKAALKIKMLEERLAEREREVELLKLELKDSVKHENGLRELQNLVEPVNIAVLKRHLSGRVSADLSISEQEQAADQSAGEGFLLPDVPRVEDICARIIEGFEMDERVWLNKLQGLVTSNSYFKNSSDYKTESAATDLDTLRTRHERALELTLERFAKILQWQSRIIADEKQTEPLES